MGNTRGDTNIINGDNGTLYSRSTVNSKLVEISQPDLASLDAFVASHGDERAKGKYEEFKDELKKHPGSSVTLLPLWSAVTSAIPAIAQLPAAINALQSMTSRL